jgi:hypothetical protein
MRKLLPSALVALVALSNTGCIKSMLTNGQIEATRQASSVFDTIGDYDLARGAAEAGLVQFEGMHKLAPDNEDALFMLTQAWVGYGFAFPADDMEAATDAGNDDLAEYHKRRARMAYDRAIFYGLELLSHKDKGFEAAKKNVQTIKAWLSSNFKDKEDGENLFWVGYGWMARVDLEKDDPAMVADLFIGAAMVERAVELDPPYNHYNGYLALAAYHARASLAEPEEARKLFDMILQKTERKDLMVQFTYAQTYACVAPNRALYDKLLAEVLQAGDTDPEQRLENALAKRKARRYQGKPRLEACGFDTSSAPAAAPPAAPSTPAPAAPAPAPAKAAPAPAPSSPAPASAPPAAKTPAPAPAKK